ncbi:putative cardiolipin synthase (CMP-forming) [Cryptotermes secundus]|uniref:cardiolipin synthase (CMP-forming) n=2 Tax=Cryptotermes secundus TaxID=105785 RepID=A0A2J7R6P4_9NEOP|nr:probable cardiolipin synthase (CMP-forming) isoform X3 [Cryptotermes secundus]XP_033606797.1 probable cardiolipin synthase (CMP-forming) isoform X3 [Cryptotermes secundus]PNF36490.1 putative cardiolipin synthase (CMP-forming) [Cryptotermes secundus]
MVTVVLKFLGTQICQTHTLRQAQLLRPRMLRWVSTLDYSMDQGQKEKQLLHGMLQKKKEHFKESGQILLKDIKETRDKVKEKMEEIIERENVLTIPNLLCISRIVMSPFLGYFILQSEYHLALGLFVFAGVSDLLDGWIARNFESQASKIGSFLDPMADKVLIATLFGALTFMDLIPVYLTGAIITRDLLLVAAAFCVRYKSLPPPRTLSRYFDVTHATAQLSPTAISKWNTGMQLVLVATTLAAPVFGYVDHPVLHVMWYVGRYIFLFASMPSLKQVTEQTETAGISASIVSLKH